MNRLLGVLLIAVTLVLVGWGYMESAGAAGVLRSEDTPERATNSLLQKIRARDFGSAFDSLANTGKLDRDDFIHDLAGTDGQPSYLLIAPRHRRHHDSPKAGEELDAAGEDELGDRPSGPFRNSRHESRSARRRLACGLADTTIDQASGLVLFP